MGNPAEDDTTDLPNFSIVNEAAPVVNVTVSGMDEVMKKAMEDAQLAMKEAQQDHKIAVSVPCEIYVGYNLTHHKLQCLHCS